MALNTDIFITLVANETIPAGRRVKYVAGNKCALASDSEIEIGVSILHSGKSSYAIGEPVGVQLKHRTVLCEAAGAFADGATVKRMASGKVGDTGSGADYGIAFGASAAAADLVEVLPL
jgi:hypothetical protein